MEPKIISNVEAAGYYASLPEEELERVVMRSIDGPEWIRVRPRNVWPAVFRYDSGYQFGLLPPQPKTFTGVVLNAMGSNVMYVRLPDDTPLGARVEGTIYPKEGE